MERAYDDAKYGRFSRRPYIDVVIPSLTDPSVAPPGRHVMSCFVQYAPYHLKGGDWDDEREAFGDAVVEALAQHAPGIKELILHRQVLTPLVLERREIVGGAAVTSEIHPGFRCPALFHSAGAPILEVVRELDLGRHGLQVIQPAVRLFAASRSASGIALYEDADRTARD